MRISGTNILDKKHIVISLMSIKGIGKPTSRKICSFLNIKFDTKTSDITDEQKGAIENYISKYIVVGDDLSRIIMSNKKRKIDIGCYDGFRLKNGLPRYGSGRSAGKTARKLLGANRNVRGNVKGNVKGGKK